LRFVAATDSADDCILRFAAVGFCEPFLSNARGAIAQALIALTSASKPSLRSRNTLSDKALRDLSIALSAVNE
jgi:hypothetical protein